MIPSFSYIIIMFHVLVTLSLIAHHTTLTLLIQMAVLTETSDRWESTLAQLEKNKN